MSIFFFCNEIRDKEFALGHKVEFAVQEIEYKHFFTKTKLLFCQVLKCPLMIL